MLTNNQDLKDQIKMQINILIVLYAWYIQNFNDIYKKRIRSVKCLKYVRYVVVKVMFKICKIA